MINIEPFIGISYYKDESEYYKLSYRERPYDILLESRYEYTFLEEDCQGAEYYKEQSCNDQFFTRINDNLAEVDRFLNYHLQKYIEKNNAPSLFFAFIRETLYEIKGLSEARKKTLLEWIETKKTELTQGTEIERGAEAPALKKIEWKGSPALFGHIFIELVKNGFIEPPLHNGEPSYSGLSKLCFEYFNVNNTTPENLKKEMNPTKNSLSDTKRAKFTIPNLSDLA